MQQSQILATISSQIPVVAVNVLAPEEMTFIQWMTETGKTKINTDTYFWNLATNGLEKCSVSPVDNGLIFNPVADYKKPPQADPLIYIFDYIANCHLDRAVFILGDVHPFVSRNSPQLSFQVLSHVKNLYNRLKPTSKRIVLLGQNIELHECLIRLVPYCEIPLPGLKTVQEHLESYLPYLAESADSKGIRFRIELSTEEKEILSRAALGLTLEEFSDFMRIAVKECMTGKGITVNGEIIPKAIKYKTRLLAQLGIELGKSAEISFGGLDLLREWLLKRRRLFSQEARNLNLPQPKGVLLAGSPGTGKSLIAKNIANILNLPLLKLDIASLLGSLVGESENNVRRALKTAEAIAPCILWIDEIDKALGQNSDSSGVSQRILGTILTFMSECTAGVFVVATCNDVTVLPSELKRKGRFDENFFVDLPNASERCQILKIHLARFGVSKIQDEYLEAIAERTPLFSGAELETLAAEAAILAFEEGRPRLVCLNDLENSRKDIIPLAIQDATGIEKMRDWASSARPASSQQAVKNTTSFRTARSHKNSDN